MFFTYVTRVCLEQKHEMVGGMSQVSPSYGYRMSGRHRRGGQGARAAPVGDGRLKLAPANPYPAVSGPL